MSRFFTFVIRFLELRNVARPQWWFPRGPYLQFLLPSQSLVWGCRQATHGRPHTIVLSRDSDTCRTTASQNLGFGLCSVESRPYCTESGEQDPSLPGNLTDRLLR